MFEKILYPTDFSDASKKALDYIKQLKEAGTKEVVILHVIDQREIDQVSHLPEVDISSEDLEKRKLASAKEDMKEIEGELSKAGFKVKTRIDKGIPFRDILKTEEEENVSVVVLGSHGKSCIAEMLLGSVSERVVRKSSKPVLVVRR